MKLVGLDLSLTATGYAGPIGTQLIQSPETGTERLRHLRDLIVWECAGADLVTIEGYAYSRMVNRAAELGELGGVVRVALHEGGIPVVTIQPSQLKRYATGKGNAPKGLVLEAAVKRSGASFGGDHNRADAYWLRQMGLAHFCPEHEDYVIVPASHRETLDKVDWPDLDAKNRSAA